MQRVEDTFVFSASDVTNFLECDHLTQLDLRRSPGELSLEIAEDEQADLLRRKGIEHEVAYLAKLHRDRRHVIEISADSPTAVTDTEQAMRNKAEVIYQAAFHDGTWRGYADFLLRVDTPSKFGTWGYEPADTKLAREPKPYFLLQLCFYAEQLARVQGVPPENVHLVMGDGRLETFRCADFSAYYRTVRDRFLMSVAERPESYPWPVPHCDVCRWNTRCVAQREDDDHLSLVANIRRSQILRLSQQGITTMAALAAQPPPLRVRGIGPATADMLRLQAELQVYRRETGENRYELLPPEGPRQGFALLHEPSPGDVFFDMEGDPFFELGSGGWGLEYLFGVYTLDGGYKTFWAHSRVEEKRAFEELIDFLIQRLDRWPDMHVYHYAAYEPAAVKRLMGAHATREDEVDRLLTVRAFVDLFAVVRQGVKVSQPSYSIKKLEPFYMESRDVVIAGGGESVVHYERWIDTQDPTLLQDIARYNELDCISTQKLRDWLLKLHTEAIGRFGEPSTLRVETPRELSETARAEETERAQVAQQLLADVPDDPDARSPEEQARWLLAQLLEYHRREAKPAWWAFFDRMSKNPEELVDDPDCLGGLEWNGADPLPDKKSFIYSLTFPPQETKLSPSEIVDTTTGKPAGRIISLDAVEGVLQLRRGPSLKEVPLPASLGPGGPYDTSVQRAAVLRVAQSVMTSTREYRALRDLLLASAPRIHGIPPGTPLSNEGDDALERLRTLTRGLDDSVLFVQGPPGAGKTYTAARAILALLRDGNRVGVAANSHKAIHKLLAEVETCADAERFTFQGVKKSSDEEGSQFSGRCTESVGDAKTISARLADIDLLAGTAWLFAREEFDQSLDYLFVDEAGQVSLADVLAIGTSARNLVLIGDPNQLSQPAQGFHPLGAGASALEHLLGGATTIPPERGLFLATTWRMHPDVCRFISEVMYENRLEPDAANATQDVTGLGTGLRFVPVEHDGNRQSSPEEATVVATTVEALVGRKWRDKNGEEHLLTRDDVLVVSPYNAQVRMLRDVLPPGAQVGTVDKFQGQEAPIVIFSMATSSGDELPRTLEFLFSRNRLNVAISRARCLAVLVASPGLLRVRCKTVDQMRMVNALSRFAEMATPLNA